MPMPSPHMRARMTSFYLMRHGQTDANRHDLACGRGTDCALNAVGMGQALAAAKRLQRAGLVLQHIVHSPMRRARETAHIIGTHLGVAITERAGLEEQDLGTWEGLPWPDVLERLQSGHSPPGGESRDAFSLRIWHALAGDPSFATQATSATAGTQTKQATAPQTLWVAHGGTFFALGWPWQLVSSQVPHATPFKMTLREHATPWHALPVGGGKHPRPAVLYTPWSPL